MATNKNNIFNRAANTARNNSIKTTLENVRKAGEELRKKKEEEEKAKKTVQPMRSLKDTFANIAHQVDNAYNSGDYLRERENRQQATPAANAPKKRTLQLATMAEEQRSVMQSWNDFLNRMNTPAAAAQNKPQSSMGIYSPKDPRNPNRVNKAIEQDFRAVHYQPVNKGAPKNQWVYEDFKKKGKGAGWLAGSEKLYESTRIDPMMSQIIETVNNLGKWDNEKDQPYYKYSARKNREIEFENQQRADAIASKMKEYENLDFLTNPENSRFYEEDVLNGAMENKAYDIVTFGLKYNDANGNPHTAGGKNGTRMSTEEYETNKEEYNQMMFREMWGDEALQTELAKNGGKLSPRYSQEMERMWDKLRLSYDDLDATKNYHLKIAEEAGKQAKAYEDYDQLMVDSGRKLSQIENASPDFIPGNERTGYGASKLDNIYSFITGNKAYADVIKNAESDERYETDTALANAYDGAIFMTPDEKELFIRYYNAGPEHREELEAFMEGLQPSLNMRKVQREEQLTKYMADVLPGSQAVASVAANKLAGGMELLAAGGRLLGVVDNDTDSDWERLSRYVKTVRTELSKNAYDHVLNKTKSEFLADLAEHGINTLFSIADFTTDIWLANGMTALTGAATAEEIAAAGKAFSLGLMSLESFGSAYYDAYQESDGDNTYATAKAGLSALLELSTETIISMDRIFSTDTEGAKRLINAILGEAFEETTGSVLEPGLQTARQMIYNYLTGKGLDGQTEWERNAQEIAEADPETYMYRDENGNLMIDKGKAMKAALSQWEEEVLWNTLAGGISAAPGSIIAEGKINQYNRKLGKTIRGAEAVVEEAGQKTSNEDYLTKIGAGMGKDTRSYELAQEMLRQKSAGKKIGNVQVGRLAQAISQETNDKVANAVQMNLANSIREEVDARATDRTEEEKQQIADVVAKATARGLNSLTAEERNVLANSKAAFDMFKELNVNKSEFAKTANEARREAGKEAGADVLENLQRMTDAAYNKAKKAIRIVTAKNATTAAERAVANGATKLMEVGEGGRTSGAPREVFVGGEAAEIVGVDTDGYKVKVNGEERTVEMDDVKAGNKVMAATMSFIEMNRASLSDKMANLMVQGAASGAVTEENVQDYLSGAYQIRVDAFLGKSAPTNTTLDPKLVQMVYDQSKADAAAIDAARTAPGKRINVNPGNGAVKLMGVDSTDTEAYEAELNKLDEGQRDQVRALGKIFKKIGVGVTFVKDATDRYGSYNIADGSVIINVAGEEANNEQHHLYVTAAHELTHWLESNAKEGYAALRDFVLQQIENSGQDLNTLVQRKQDQYNAQIEDMNNNGDVSYEPLTIDGAIAEIVADGCDQVLTNEATIQKLAEDNKGLYNKIKNFVTDFINLVRKGSAGITTSTSRYSRWVQDQNTLAKLWNVAYEEATTGTESYEAKETGELNAPANVEITPARMNQIENGNAIPTVKEAASLAETKDPENLLFSLRNVDFREKTIRKNMANVSTMENIVIDGTAFKVGDRIKDAVGNYYDKLKNKVKSKVFGNVEIKRSDIGESLGHGMSSLKAATYEAVPKVIKYGELVDYQENYGGRKYDSAILAAPVKISNGPAKGEYYIGVVVNLYRNGKNTYYTHDGVVAVINKSDGTSIIYDPSSHKAKTTADTKRKNDGYHQLLTSVLEKIPKRNTNLKTNSQGKRRFSLAEREGHPLTTDADGNPLTVTLPGNTVAKEQLSLASWTQAERDRVRKDLINAGFTAEEADGWIRDVNSVAAIIAADKDRLDYEVTDPEKTYLKKNQDYYFTLDASTLCAKRLLYQGTFNKVQALLPNTALMPEDLIDLYNLMKEKGYETPCGICYVESRRRWLDKYASQWLEKYKGPYKPTLNEVTTSDGLERLRKEHPEAYRSFQKAMSAKGSANPKVVQLRTDYRGDISRLTPGDVQKVKDIGGLRVQSFSDFEVPHLIDMMQAVMDMSSKKLTSQAYTKVPAFAAVFGDTGIKINLSLIGKGRGVDANGKLIFDDVEGMPYEQAMKLRKKYSKNVGTILVGINDDHIVAAMADDTIDFIIPFHKSGWSNKELEKMPVLKGYKDYTSQQNEKIITGKRTKRIVYKTQAAVDNWVEKNGSTYPDYRVKQTADGFAIVYSDGYTTRSFAKHKKATGEDLSNFEPVGAHKYWNFEESGEWNARNYLRMCAESHRMPKFSQFLTDNGDGTFSLPEGNDARSKAIRKGYWKTLIDFKMYDNAGNGSMQTEVTPNVNMTEARKVLKDYTLDRVMPSGMKVSRTDNNTLPVADEVAEEYVRRFKEKHKDRKQFSMREMDDQYMAAVNSGDMETAQLMVRDAAEKAGAFTNKNGKPIKLYHGTKKFGFTVFDTSRTKFDVGAIFATSSESVANGYSDFGKNRGASGKYIEDDGTDETIIKNAKNVLDAEVTRLTEKKANELRQENLEKFRELAEKETQAMEESPDYIPPEEIENEFWEVVNAFNDTLSEDKLLFDEDEDFRNEYRSRGGNWVADRNKYEAREKLMEYFREHDADRERMKQTGRGYYKLLFADYDHSDGIIDLEYSYKNLLNLEDKFIYRGTDQVTSRDKLQDIIETVKGNGVYTLYGIKGDNPLIIDAGKSFWTAIKAPEIGDSFYSTDDIAKWAKKKGYTSVVIKNVMDPGVVNAYGDDYIFFDANQLKSADPVTYDDNGNVIPLSERFNTENEDIRWSLQEKGTANAAEWLQDIDAETLTDPREKKLLQDYQQKSKALADTRGKISGMMDELKSATGDKARKLRINIGTEQNKAIRLVKQLNEVTDGEAFSKMMQSAQQVIDAEIEGKTQEEIDQRIEELEKEIRRLRGNNQGTEATDLDSLKRQLQSEATRKVVQEQQYWRNLITNDWKVREAANQREKTRKQVSKIYNRMARLLTDETDEKNIPEGYKSIVRAALKPILEHDNTQHGSHITENDRKQRERQKNVLQLMDQRFGSDLDLSVIEDEDVQDKVREAIEKIKEGVNEFSKIRRGLALENLTDVNAALKTLHEGITTIYDLVQKAREIDLNGRRIAIADVAYEVDEDARKRDVYRERMGKLGEKMNMAEQKIYWGNMTPEYFFKTLKNNGLSMIWDAFHKAEDRNGKLTQLFKGKIEKIASDNGYKTWDQSKKTELKLSSGKTVQLTAEQMMSLYATYKREMALGFENSHHLETGGFVLEQNADKLNERKAVEKVPVKFRAEDFQTLEQTMTDQQKAYADAWVELMSTDGSRLGNDTSMRMYGIKKYNETYYFPFSVWDGVKNKASNSGSGLNPTNNNRAAHQGFTNRIKANAGNAVLIRNFTDVCVDHINQMITYSTMAPSIEAMNKVLNYQVTEGEGGALESTKRNIETVLTERYGKNAVDYLRTLLQDLNGGVTQDRRTSMIEPLMSVFKKNAVGGSLSVALQQPLSYIRAATMISPKYLAEALNPAYYKGSLNEMRQHSGIAVIKAMGRFDMNYGRSAREYLTPEKAKTRAQAAYEKTVDVANALPEKMDQMTWTRMWTACKLETAARNPGMDMGSEEFLNKVAERFNEVMRLTQVYDSILVKSSNMRSTAWTARVITAFKAEPTLTANMLMDAWQNRKTKGGRKALGGALAAYYLSAILQAAMKSIVGAGRTPDEKKTLAENFANKFAYNFIGEGNPIALIPGYSEIVDALSGNDVKDNAYGVISNIYKSLTTTRDVLQGKSNGTWRDLEDTAGQLTQIVSGIPLKNLMRDTRAVYNWALGNYANRARTETDEEGNERVVEGRATSGAVLKYQTRDTILTNDLIGAINKILGTAGAKTNNDAYYGMIYDAEKKGNTGRADELKEYLVAGKGVKDSSLKSGVAGAAKKDPNATTEEIFDFLISHGYAEKSDYLTEQYKKGEITEDEYKELYRKYFPDAKQTVEQKLLGFVQDKFNDGKISEAELMEGYKKYSTDEKGEEYLLKKEQAKWRDGTIKDADLKAAYKKYGKTEDDYDEYMWGQKKTQYKEGKLSKQEMEALWKKKYPEKPAEDMWFFFDKIEWEKKTGKTSSNEFYYRIHEGIENNKAELINQAVQIITSHGKTKNQIAGSIQGVWKDDYLKLKDGSAEKVRLKDALIKAYKAIGYSASQAENTINKWKKKK